MRFIFNKQETGRRGEEIAAEFLERKGLIIADRNYRSRWGELDLVALEMPEQDTDSRFSDDYDPVNDEERREYEARLRQNKGTVHFVEVKTRRVTLFGTPGEAVTYAKQQKIKKTALTWLQEQGMYFPDISFDVVEVWVAGGTAKIRWLRHCF